MRIVVVNRHPMHDTYAARICKALDDAGHDVRFLGAAAAGNSAFQRIRTGRPPWRGPIPPLRSWVLDYQDRKRWDLRQADRVIDLDAVRALWVLPRGPNVRVVHRIDELCPSSSRGRARRARLREVARRGDRFVAHTEIARGVLADIIGDDAVVQVPLLGPEPSPRPPHIPSHPANLLFVGTDRTEKGLDLLRSAAEATGNAVRCIGGIGYPLSEEQLAAAYAVCDLVVCPYRDEYAATGSASLVIAEAIAYAAPVLATPALRGLFPVGYGGVEFATAASAPALTEALRSLDLARLSARASVEAPAAASMAAPRAYVSALLEFS